MIYQSIESIQVNFENVHSNDNRHSKAQFFFFILSTEFTVAIIIVGGRRRTGGEASAFHQRLNCRE